MPGTAIFAGRVPWKGTDLLPRVLVGLGIAATVAQNVAAGSRGGYGGALLGVLPPAGMLLALETLIWMVRRLAGRKDAWAWCLGAGIPLAGLAGIAGVISYLHSLTVARWTAAPGEVDASLTEHLLPLVADLMIATGSVALVALARSRARSGSPKTGSAKDGAPKTGSPVPEKTRAQALARIKDELPNPERSAAGGSKQDGKQGQGSPGRGRPVQPFPAVPPDRLPELLAMTERPLAEELSRIAGYDVTRWKATQFKKHHAADPAHGPDAVPANGSNGAHANGNGSAHPERED